MQKCAKQAGLSKILVEDQKQHPVNFCNNIMAGHLLTNLYWVGGRGQF